jgi:hypothetical protein
MESAKARCEGGGPGNAGCRPEQVLRVGPGRAGPVEGVVLVGPGSRSGRVGPGLTESGGRERKSARSYG